MAYYPPGSLLAFLAEVPDPRARHGRRHPLVAMLAHACCAILCGCRGYAAIAQWGRDQPIELMHRLGYRRTPRLLRRLPGPLLPARRRRLRGRRGPLGRPPARPPARPSGLRAVALDGKSLARQRARPTPRRSTCWRRSTRRPAASWRQARVPAETNEHKAALALLEGLVLEGRVVTGDAAFCQRDLCRQVVDAGGHYLLKVDDNQPTLKADIAAAFGPAFSPLRPAAGGRAGRRGDDPGQARRPGRAAAAADHDDAQRLPRLAGGGAGRPARSGRSPSGGEATVEVPVR